MSLVTKRVLRFVLTAIVACLAFFGALTLVVTYAVNREAEALVFPARGITLVDRVPTECDGTEGMLAGLATRRCGSRDQMRARAACYARAAAEHERIYGLSVVKEPALASRIAREKAFAAGWQQLVALSEPVGQ